MVDFARIHIGDAVKKCIEEREFDIVRIEKVLHCSEEEINKILSLETIDTGILLKLSKLLEYDFFRLYSQHLILYSPPTGLSPKKQESLLPAFRKNVYTQELIHFVLELIHTGKKTRSEIIQDYVIPKTTLYKWISKYQKSMEQAISQKDSHSENNN